MASKSKLELLLELGDKMFNNKLIQVQQKLNAATGNMESRLSKFKTNALVLFSDFGSKIGGYFKQAFEQLPFAKYLTNPIVLMGAAVYKLKSYLTDAVSGYKKVAQEESKLAQVMKNTMGAGKTEFLEVKTVVSQQQKEGVIDAGTQMAGAQELSTYLTQTDSLKKLLPVMNDMLAQQYGLNASQEQSANIASMLGKVMDGQVGALSRYGYKFDEAQEKILKHGTEAQRAAVLFDVVSDAVGGVNKALAATPEGKLKQLANESDDIKERFGGLVVAIQTSFSGIQEKTNAMLSRVVGKLEVHREKIIALFQKLSSALSKGIDQLEKVLRPVVNFFIDWYKALEEGTPWVINLTWALGALAGIIPAVTIATKLWAGAQWVLNSAFMAFPGTRIALIIVGLIALTKYIIKNWNDWSTTTKILVGIVGGLAAAIGIWQLVVNGAKLATQAWTAAQWLLNVALNANPIGLIAGAIIGLIALVTVIIKKWDDWGAALTLFMGPVGLIIGMFKSLYDHWDSIKKAFKDGGILEGLKRIGVVLLDALLKPLQQVLEVAAKFDPTGLAKKGLAAVSSFRKSNDLITPGEREKEAREKIKAEASLYHEPEDDKKKKPRPTVGDDITKTTAEANQVRKVDIKIDSFIKGNIQVAASAAQGMTWEEIESKFKDMFMRVVLNGENI